MIVAFATRYSASLFSLLILILFVVWRKEQSYLSVMTVILLALSCYYYMDRTKIQFQESGEISLIAQFTDQVRIDGRILKGFVKTYEGDVLYARYTISSEKEKEQLLQLPLYQYRLSIDAKFEEIPAAAHEYAFYMSNYLQMNGAKGIIHIDNIRSMRHEVNWMTHITTYRQQVIHHIEKTFPTSLVAEAKALLVGDRSDMSEETAAQYRTLGITHLFAISGLHVGLLTYFVRECLLRCRMRHEYVNLLLFCMLPIYALLVGGAPSVWRASIVTMLLLCVKAFHWRIRVDQLLAATCLFFILLKPYIILQPGFQLSYGAAFALIYSNQILAQTSSYIKQSFLITAISQVALYPVLLIHFYEVSLSSFFVNLLYVPLYSVMILPINLVLLISSVIFPSIAHLLFIIYEPIRTWIEVMTDWIAEIPYQLWTPGKPSLWLLSLAVVGIGLFFSHLERRQSIFIGLMYLLVPVIIIHVAPYLNSNLRVHFVDVGQGDSIVIELPYRRGVYVIDAGGVLQFGDDDDWRTPAETFEVGRQVVVPFLRGKGITAIDYLVLSHPHIDHIGGAHEVMEEIRVKAVHTSPNTIEVSSMEKVIEEAIKQNIPITIKRNGDYWETKDAHFMYMGPQGDLYEGNDSSLVLYMQSRGNAFLFAGDIEEKGERQFLSLYGELVFPPTILKVAHHGSKTSSTKAFLEAVNPVLAIAMQGRNNRFQHPNDEVVERYKELAIPLLTTQEVQTITVTINRHGVLSVDHH